MTMNDSVSEGTVARRTAVVIGSGFGGSVTACRLAQASAANTSLGLDVIVLERGRRYGKDDFPRLQLPVSMTSDPSLQSSVRLPDFARFSWRNDYGLFDVKNLGQLMVVQAAGLGGGSLIYGNVLLRAPEHILSTWPEPFQSARLAHYYELAEAMLGAATAPDDYEKTRHFEQAATARKLPIVKVPLAINFGKARENAFGKQQGQCNGCGDCIIGCSLHAKNTLDLNYLALAEKNGAEIRSLTEVLAISRDETSGKWVVRFVRHDQGEGQGHIDADYVFLAAGAIGTTDLLLRNPSIVRDDIKKLVGGNLFANGDSLGVVFDTADTNNPWCGPTITRSVVHREAIAVPTEPAEPPPQDDWFLIQDGGVPPSLKRALGYFKSGMWLGRNRFGPQEKRPAGRVLKIGPLTDLFMDLPLLFSAFRRSPANPNASTDKEWERFVPPDLWPLADFIANPGSRFRREVDRVDQIVVEKLKSEIGRRFGLASWLPGMDKIINREVMLSSVIAALQERYSVVGYLIDSNSLLDTLVAAAQYLLLGQGPTPSSAVLLAMGPDHAWVLERSNDRLRASRAQPTIAKRDDVLRYGAQERVMRELATELGGELRTNPGWAIGRRPVTVHTQGGCSMPTIAAEPSVTVASGALVGAQNLYVMDASAFPSSVGVNPSLTIAAVAEQKIEAFINSVLELSWTTSNPTGVDRFVIGDEHRVDAALARRESGISTARQPIGIGWSEWMTGTAASSSWDPQTSPEPDPPISKCEDSARWGLVNDCHVEADFRARIPDLDYFLLEESPTVLIEGSLRIKAPGPLDTRLTFDCQGKLTLQMKAMSLSRMRYAVSLYPVGSLDRVKSVGGPMPAPLGKLLGTKYFTDDPGIDSFLDATTLYTSLSIEPYRFLGVIRVPLVTFVGKQLPTFAVTGGEDLSATGKVWALARFAKLFFGSMADVYLPELFFRQHKA